MSSPVWIGTLDVDQHVRDKLLWKHGVTWDEVDDEIARIDAGETAWDPDSPEVELKFKQPLDKITGVRVTDAQWKRLSAEAEEIGIGPTTLVRMWILEKLRALDRARQSA